LILLAPIASEAGRWSSGDARLIARLFSQIVQNYSVDPSRIVVHGYEGGGELAFQLAYHDRRVIRAAACVEASPNGPLPENDPAARLAIYAAAASASRVARPLDAAIAALRENGLPVTFQSLGEAPRYLNAEELAELARWIDTLDRM
jgi:poly(3-hydroxybutyrate) depolymerase